MNDDIEKAIASLGYEALTYPITDHDCKTIYGISYGDHDRIVAKLKRAMDKLSEQRDRKIYTNKQWDDGGVMADDAEIIEILTGDAE